MRNVKAKLISILIWLIVAVGVNLIRIYHAFSDEINNLGIRYGVGINDGGSQTKAFFVNYEDHINSVFAYKLEVGGYNDATQRNGVIGLASPSFGIRTEGHGLYAKLFFGPALISATDNRLSSLFEFNNDVEVGIKGFNNVGIGLSYKHLSNAGIVGPNLGRDFMLFKLELPISN